MKFSNIAVIGGLATLASADLAKRDYTQTATATIPVVCTGQTVTQVVTVTAGAGAGAGATGGIGNGTPAAGATGGSGNGTPAAGAGTITQTLTYTSTVSGKATTVTTTTTAMTTSSGAKATHKVQVGADGDLIYGPNQVNASVGDVIEFNFLAENHTVTQSSFNTPCTYNGGFDTGFNQDNPQNISGKFIKSFTVNTTQPTWFYCRQTVKVNHCGKGMVFGLNPAGKMDQFIKNAEAQNGNLTTGSAPTSTGSGTGAVVTVTVGLDDGKTLRFSPPFLANINQGSKIHFDFRAKNHTLTESSFNAPCTKLDGTTIDTNFHNVNLADIPNQNATDIVITSPATQPRWFYCKQANGTPQGHCGQGMVFAINTNQTQYNQFLAKAEATLPKVKGRSPAF